MAWAPVKAGVRVERSSMSACTISTPREIQDWALALVGERVRPRIFQFGEEERKAFATLEPWKPVMPVMTMSFLDMMFVVWYMIEVLNLWFLFLFDC